MRSIIFVTCAELTHPDIAMLVIPLYGQAVKRETFFFKPSLRSREGGRAKQRSGELNSKYIYIWMITSLHKE